MVQARISNYVKNSDFTTQQQRGIYDLDLTIPSGTYSYGRTFTVDVAVPRGVYFENVLLSCSIRPGEYYPANHSTIMGTDQSWYFYIGVFQQSPGIYRLQVTLMGLDGSGEVTTSGFTAHAKFHLSVSPFA